MPILLKMAFFKGGMWGTYRDKNGPEGRLSGLERRLKPFEGVSRAPRPPYLQACQGPPGPLLPDKRMSWRIVHSAQIDLTNLFL